MEPTSIDPKLFRGLGVDTFNATWDLIAKSDRTADEVLEMISSAHASYWFWSHYPERTDENLSIGLWQLARVYALAKDGAMAGLFGEKCIGVSRSGAMDTFFLAYAYEAAARGHLLQGKLEVAREYLAKAREALASSKEEETGQLKMDLEELEGLA